MSENAQRYVRLQAGDPAPTFCQRTKLNPEFGFDTMGGRYLVLGFFVSAGNEVGRMAIHRVLAHREMFDDKRMSFFGVSLDPQDESENRVHDLPPGIRYFWDFDRSVSMLYGSLPADAQRGDGSLIRRFWVVIDPTLRVMRVFSFTAEDPEHEGLFRYLAELPPPERFLGFEMQAPVIILANVLEGELCRELIEWYEREGGGESGFMREVGGKTVGVQDFSHKRRKDCMVTDRKLIGRLQNRMVRRVFPELLKVYSFNATRMERYLVGCYAAEDGGHFRPHRDNTTKATAHRRFAISINLNADFEGGELSFPEYGPRKFKAPPGAALVFPGAILHAVSKVTKGRRYAFLPFVYDEAAKKIRDANAQYLSNEPVKVIGGPAADCGPGKDRSNDLAADAI